jgi:hypothetical protein
MTEQNGTISGTVLAATMDYQSLLVGARLEGVLGPGRTIRPEEARQTDREEARGSVWAGKTAFAGSHFPNK